MCRDLFAAALRPGPTYPQLHCGASDHGARSRCNSTQPQDSGEETEEPASMIDGMLMGMRSFQQVAMVGSVKDLEDPVLEGKAHCILQ